MLLKLCKFKSLSVSVLAASYWPSEVCEWVLLYALQIPTLGRVSFPCDCHVHVAKCLVRLSMKILQNKFTNSFYKARTTRHAIFDHIFYNIYFYTHSIIAPSPPLMHHKQRVRWFQFCFMLSMRTCYTVKNSSNAVHSLTQGLFGILYTWRSATT